MISTKLWDSFLIFFVLILMTVLVGESTIYFLDLNQLIYKDFSEQLTIKQIEDIFETKERWSWIGYVALPILLFLKITFVAWVIAIGGFFNEVHLSHAKYFRIALLAEFIFLVPAILKIFWFVNLETDYSYTQVQQFFPLSLQNILDTSNLPPWSLYPIQIANVFEVLYWVFLFFLVNKASETNLGPKIVGMSYGPALIIWIIFIMFLTLNYM